MNKLTILRKVLDVIQGSQPVPDETINSNCSPVDSGVAILPDETADERVIADLCWNFAKALTERDFERLDGRAEYHFYTVDHLIELIRNNDEQSTIKLFNENKIKSKFEDCEFLSITFSADQEQVVVVYNVRTCVVSADDKYFKELNKKNKKKNRISGGTPFSTTYTLLVKKEKGTWKIDKFEASEENIKMGTNV
ncbi:conserved hypothetical protein [Candidatus Desulfosporosinus infrequens]|uniref:Tim44-like domain-containing protein n=1 Tax=Candidatus Desulfosporosinus infrequens TaxID=2043169 RepID=A0A2U3LLA7_9FIRM|nr:conserved hypothetical protein [Candidatus Desulfosporosinus infrequens]